MDHAYIDAADIVSRYVLRRLNAEEEQAFEAHFVDCPECLDRIDQTKRLRAGLAALATNAAMSPAPVPAPTTAGAFMSRWLALAAGLVLGAALALAAAHIIGPRDRDRGEPSQQPPQTAAGSTQTATAAPAPTAASTPTAGHAEAARPDRAADAAVPVVALSIVRGAASGRETPATLVRLPKQETPFVVLLLDTGAASFKSYRVTLTKIDGATTTDVWTADHLTPTTREALAVAVPSALLHPGDYAVRLDGDDRAGRAVSAGHYAFRLTP
jgi:hypothetical protein